MKKIMVITAAVILVLTAILASYIFLGCSNPNLQARYHVIINNPAKNEVMIRMVLFPVGEPFLHLFIREPQIPGHVSRIKNILIRQNGKKLFYWQTLPGIADLQTVWVGFSTMPLTITYTVSPLARKDNTHGKMIGFIHKDYGYLRGMNVFYTPLSIGDFYHLIRRQNSEREESGRAKVFFQMPAGFAVNSPLGKDKSGIGFNFLRNMYFGLGKLNIRQEKIPGSVVSLAVYKGFPDNSTRQYQSKVFALYQEIFQLTGVIPKDKTPCRAITILPHELTYGGAAGANSIISEESDEIITHEMFHWWNGETIDTTHDANWLKEGFTTYYAAKILWKAGIWNETALNQYIKNLSTQFERASLGKPVDLTQASERMITGKGSETDYTFVYNGGALLAYGLDKKTEQIGVKFDRIWKKLSEINQPVSTKIFIGILRKMSGKQIADEFERKVHGIKIIYKQF